MHAATLHRRLPWEPIAIALFPALLACAIALSAGNPSRVALVGVGAAFCIWLLVSERYERGLVVLVLYLGLIDGFIRLRTGRDELTIVRDLLLYSIVAGITIRALVHHTRLSLPPLGGWVLAFGVAVLVQLANPLNGTLAHSLAALRPHLEFVPLFFLGYLAMRSVRRLEVFLVLVVAIGAINGAVSFVQFSQTPEQLGRWGPGYQARVFGENVSARQFVDSRGNRRPRPFGLGADSAAGGAFGMLAACAPFALLALAWQRRKFVGIAGLIGAGFVLLGVATSQSRSAVVGAVVVVGAFFLFAFGRRTIVAPIIAAVIVGTLGMFVVSQLATSTTIGSFDRYRTIAPDQVLSTAYDYRRDDIALVGDYVRDHPLGAGLGSVGPAAGEAGAPPDRGLNAEGQLNFLVIELGVPGTIAFGAFLLALVAMIVRRLPRVVDPALRLSLAAVAAPLFGVLAWSLGGVISTLSPLSPYLWFSAGVLAYWLGTRVGDPRPETTA